MSEKRKLENLKALRKMVCIFDFCLASVAEQSQVSSLRIWEVGEHLLNEG